MTMMYVCMYVCMYVSRWGDKCIRQSTTLTIMMYVERQACVFFLSARAIRKSIHHTAIHHTYHATYLPTYLPIYVSTYLPYQNLLALSQVFVPRYVWLLSDPTCMYAGRYVGMYVCM